MGREWLNHTTIEKEASRGGYSGLIKMYSLAPVRREIRWMKISLTALKGGVESIRHIRMVQYPGMIRFTQPMNFQSGLSRL